MKIIPFERVELKSPLPIQEVSDLLYQSIRPKRDIITNFSFRSSKNDKVFEGVILDDKFKIQRIINMRNSFLPQITGEIYADKNGTKLMADLKIHKFVLVFMIFWLSVVFIAFVMISIGVYFDASNPFALLIPLVMFIFGIGLIHFGFNMERENSINDLKRVINREKIQYIKYD
ncbi:MAG TPA: hypothetical protein VFD77_04635 [Brumimicrobium sp.]|nr:hypothetical protein [Brumimicrobium sp.]